MDHVLDGKTEVNLTSLSTENADSSSPVLRQHRSRSDATRATTSCNTTIGLGQRAALNRFPRRTFELSTAVDLVG